MIHTTIKKCEQEDIRVDADVTGSVELVNGEYVPADDYGKPIFAALFCLNCGAQFCDDMPEDVNRAVQEHLAKATANV